MDKREKYTPEEAKAQQEWGLEVPDEMIEKEDDKQQEDKSDKSDDKKGDKTELPDEKGKDKAPEVSDDEGDAVEKKEPAKGDKKQDKTDDRKQDKAGEKKDDSDAEEEVVKLGKHEITTEEYNTLLEKAEKFYGKEKFHALDAEMREKILESSYNTLEASKAADKRHRENAEERKSIQSLREEFEAEKAKFEEEKTAAERDLETVREKIAEKEKFIKETKVKDEFDEDEKIQLKIDKAEAKKDIEALKRFESLTEKSIQDKTEKFKGEHAAIVNGINIAMLQEEFPELRTVRDVADLYADWQSGKLGDEFEKLPAELQAEIMRVDRINTILEDYYRKRPKQTITQFYKIKKYSMPALPEVTERKRKVKTEAEKYEEIKKKQAENKDAAYSRQAGKGGKKYQSPLEMDGEEYAKKTGW